MGNEGGEGEIRSVAENKWRGKKTKQKRETVGEEKHKTKERYKKT